MSLDAINVFSKASVNPRIAKIESLPLPLVTFAELKAHYANINVSAVQEDLKHIEEMLQKYDVKPSAEAEQKEST